MGNFVSDFFDDLTGKTGAQAAQQSAQIQSDAALANTEEYRRQFDQITQLLAPFVNAGTDALGPLQQGSTVGGLDQILSEIFGSDTFQTLTGERERSMTGLLGAGGLTRSGAGLESIAAIPTDLALQIEAILNGRQSNLATAGQNAAVQQGTFGDNMISNINSSNNLAAQAQASGVLGAQQSHAQGTQNILNGLIASANPDFDPSKLFSGWGS